MRRTTTPGQGPDRVETGPRQSLKDIGTITIITTRQKYGPDMPKRIYTMACLGLTIAQIAESTGVMESTMDNWLAKYPEARAAYEKGKYSADFDVELALRKRALGYEYEEIKYYSGVDSLGRPWSREVRQIKRVEPDVTACIFWEKNRHPERWQDVNSINATNIQVNNINFDLFTEEEQELARSMAIKQLSGGSGDPS